MPRLPRGPQIEDIPSRGGFRSQTRRGRNIPPNAKNVRNMNFGRDPGVTVPNNLVTEGVERGIAAQTIAGISDAYLKVETKLKKREDDRFLLDSEEQITTDLNELSIDANKSLDLGNPDEVKGVNEKASKIFQKYDEGASKLEPDNQIKYENLKGKLYKNFTVEIAKINQNLTSTKDQGRVFGTALTLGNDPRYREVGIGEAFNKFEEIYENRYASQFNEDTEYEMKRVAKIRIFNQQVESILIDGTSEGLGIAEEFINDPSVYNLQFKQDGKLDGVFNAKIKSLKGRVKGIKDGRSDVLKRMEEVPRLQAEGILPEDNDDPLVQQFVINNKIPDKKELGIAENLANYNAELKKLPIDSETGNPDPREVSVLGQFYGIKDPVKSEYEIKEAFIVKYNEDHPDNQIEKGSVLEKRILNLPTLPSEVTQQKIDAATKIKKAVDKDPDLRPFLEVDTPEWMKIKNKVDQLNNLRKQNNLPPLTQPEIEAQYDIKLTEDQKIDLKIKTADKLSAAATGASTFKIEALGLTPPKDDQISDTEKIFASFKTMETNGFGLTDDEKKEVLRNKLGLKDKEPNPLEQMFKNIKFLKTEQKMEIGEDEIKALARKTMGFPQSEEEQIAAAKLQAKINTIKKVGEAVGVAEEVEKTPEDIRDNVKQLVGIEVPEDKQNAIELLSEKIQSAKQLIDISSEEETLLYKKALNLPLSEEEKVEAAKLEGRLSAITKDAEVRKGIELQTPKEPVEIKTKDVNSIRKAAAQTIAGIGENYQGTLTPSQTKAINELSRLTTEYFKKGDDISLALVKASKDMFDKNAIPKPPAEAAIDRLLIDTGIKPADEDELNSAQSIYENTTKKINLEDATDLRARAINAWNKFSGVFDSGMVDKAVVRGSQMLLLLANDMVIALAKNPKIPVHEQKRLLNMIPEPGVFNNVPQVQEQLKIFKQEILKDIKLQKKFISPGVPKKKREAAYEKIISLAPILARINQFELNEFPEFKNVKSINNASKEDLIKFRDGMGKNGLQAWKKENPEKFKAFTDKFFNLTAGKKKKIKAP